MTLIAGYDLLRTLLVTFATWTLGALIVTFLAWIVGCLTIALAGQLRREWLRAFPKPVPPAPAPIIKVVSPLKRR